MTNLVIIESPNKANKIKSYLGPGWTVMASFGHVRDLPNKEMGVQGPDYVPKYVTTARKGVLSNLKSAAKQASAVYLATDPDREGEAIAWHVAKALRLPKSKTHRVVFNEITKKAVNDAIRAPRAINEDLFSAQQARRVLDRLVGYSVSPAMSKLANARLSAGRVQSIAVKLVAERDAQIKAFVSTDHFGVMITVNGHQAKWETKPFISDPDFPYITDKGIAGAVMETNQVRVIQYQQGERLKQPPKPFTTLDLCREASNKLNSATEKTMQTAQKLFEQGLITYHRTDNHNLSEDGLKLVRDALIARGHEADLPEQVNTWKNKAGAQEAHEAIRPTGFSTDQALDDDQRALLTLIEKRTLASQMKPARYHTQKVIFESMNVEYNAIKPTFVATASTQVYAGWEAIYQDSTESEDDHRQGGDSHHQKLPEYQKDQAYTVQDVALEELKTKPPAHYSESTLLKKLESEGVGRPSTYASIIKTIKSRDYVLVKGKAFHITDTGNLVYQLLNDKFDFMDIGYTRSIEATLDEIALGQDKYQSLLSECDQSIKANLGQISENVSINVEQIPCPQCGDGHLRRIKGKKGFFWGCSSYKNGCKATYQDARGKPSLTPNKQAAASSSVISDEFQCPDCGAGLIRRKSTKKKNTYWWGCSGFPKCKNTWLDQNAQPLGLSS